ncbi:toll/interleukin-1 receptor domain-containing protein, partial [Streptomyces sp. NPDC006208]|uniref:toll/interleukin-1 receptor domain-containing protein n=1 Tax=Streptomyces sp. NPDC006208 TaxID=3156734 RepID=UPI0033AB2163
MGGCGVVRPSVGGLVLGLRRGCALVGEGGRVFVSHAGADRAWAEWVAWQLVDAG